jgi:hypothetical protein
VRFAAVDREEGRENNPPDRLIFHGAGDVDGKWAVMDV